MAVINQDMDVDLVPFLTNNKLSQTRDFGGADGDGIHRKQCKSDSHPCVMLQSMMYSICRCSNAQPIIQHSSLVLS